MQQPIVIPRVVVVAGYEGIPKSTRDRIRRRLRKSAAEYLGIKPEQVRIIFAKRDVGATGFKFRVLYDATRMGRAKIAEFCYQLSVDGRRVACRLVVDETATFHASAVPEKMKIAPLGAVFSFPG